MSAAAQEQDFFREANAERVAGRPKGSKNKRTEQLVTYIQTAHGVLPATELADRALMPVEDYARLMGLCDRKGHVSPDQYRAASARQEAMLKDLMPYTASKMPIAIQHTGLPTAAINMNFGAAPRTSDALTINPVKSITYDDDAESVAHESVAQDD